MTEKAISRILIRGLQEQGIRPDLPKGVRRHEFQGVHGMRKFLKTRAEQVMLRTNVEYIIGHSLGISQSYYRPTEHELYTDYLKAIPLLTISLNLTDVQKQQEALEERDEQQEQESEKMKKRIEELTEEQKKLNEMVATSMQTLASTLRMFTSVDEKTGNVPIVKVQKWKKDTLNMLNTFIEQEQEQ
jgi:hypothetical protein